MRGDAKFGKKDFGPYDKWKNFLIISNNLQLFIEFCQIVEVYTVGVLAY